MWPWTLIPFQSTKISIAAIATQSSIAPSSTFPEQRTFELHACIANSISCLLIILGIAVPQFTPYASIYTNLDRPDHRVIARIAPYKSCLILIFFLLHISSLLIQQSLGVEEHPTSGTQRQVKIKLLCVLVLMTLQGSRPTVFAYTGHLQSHTSQEISLMTESEFSMEKGSVFKFNDDHPEDWRWS